MSSGDVVREWNPEDGWPLPTTERVYIVVCPDHGPYVWNDDYANGCPAIVDYDGVTCKEGWVYDESKRPESAVEYVAPSRREHPAEMSRSITKRDLMLLTPETLADLVIEQRDRAIRAETRIANGHASTTDTPGPR